MRKAETRLDADVHGFWVLIFSPGISTMQDVLMDTQSPARGITQQKKRRTRPSK
jgi:hypothetical protein